MRKPKIVSVNRLSVLTGAVLLSTVIPVHAETVDLQGQIAVETPRCSITLVPVATNITANLEFSSEAIAKGTAGVATTTSGEATYDVRLGGGGECAFGNVAVKMPVVQNQRGGRNNVEVPLIHTTSGDLPVVPYLARVMGHTNENNTGTGTLVTDIRHGSVAFDFSTSTTNPISASTTPAGDITTNNWFNLEQYRSQPATLSTESFYTEPSSGADRWAIWPYGGAVKDIVCAPTSDEVSEDNFANIPAASLANYQSITIGIGMAYSRVVFVAGAVDNGAVINGDTFHGSGTIEVTMS